MIADTFFLAVFFGGNPLTSCDVRSAMYSTVRGILISKQGNDHSLFILQFAHCDPFCIAAHS